MNTVILRFPYAHPFFLNVACDMLEKLEYNVAGIVSFNLEEKMSSYRGYPIYPLNDILKLSWDTAVYACEEKDFVDILPRMVELGIGKTEQFKNVYDLLQQAMIRKYEDFADPTIQETLEYWKTHRISVFNQHIGVNTLDKIFFDETCNLPYLFFKDIENKIHKMYYPKNYDFHVRDGEKFVLDLLTEQLPTSPHIYIKGKHKVNTGDIVIDAGVCEGNFALKYVDTCSKMYLFEPEEVWQEPLKQTFKDYGDKVEIIPKFVSNTTEGKNITIDDALPDLRDKNIFLKMDVEGAEPLALRGAKRILADNKVKASVCTYHNADDLIKVKGILQNYGYKISTSNGYMSFLWDINIFKTTDFRKGVVYAEN